VNEFHNVLVLVEHLVEICAHPLVIFHCIRSAFAVWNKNCKGLAPFFHLWQVAQAQLTIFSEHIFPMFFHSFDGVAVQIKQFHNPSFLSTSFVCIRSTALQSGIVQRKGIWIVLQSHHLPTAKGHARHVKTRLITSETGVVHQKPLGTQQHSAPLLGS